MCLRLPCEPVSVQIRMCQVAFRETPRSPCRESGSWISSSSAVPVGEKHSSPLSPQHRPRFPPGWVGPLGISRFMGSSSSCSCNGVTKQDLNRKTKDLPLEASKRDAPGHLVFQITSIKVKTIND